MPDAPANICRHCRYADWTPRADWPHMTCGEHYPGKCTAHQPAIDRSQFPDSVYITIGRLGIWKSHSHPCPTFAAAEEHDNA